MNSYRHTAIDVLIRTNTPATPLGEYDIVVALVQAGTDQSLNDMVADTRKDNHQIARCYSPEDLALTPIHQKGERVSVVKR